jgi:integrase
MARKVDVLTTLFVRSAPAGMHADGDGLYLQVTASKDGGLNRSWILKYPIAGKTREMGLGPLHRVSLAQARKKRDKAREAIDDGLDPIEARRQKKAQAALEAAKSVSFWQATETYLTSDKAKAWGNPKHAAEVRRSLTVYVKPIVGNLPVAAVDTSLVLRVLEQEIEGDDGELGTFWSLKTQTADRVRNRIEKILDAAKLRGLRTGDNPARWRGHLEASLTKVSATKNHNALPFADLPAFMATLRSYPNVEARALEFLILNANRTNEVLGAKWSEINRATKVWTVPAERMKGTAADRRPHEIPLSERALELLNEMEARRAANPDSAFVFPGRARARLHATALYSFLLYQMKRGDISVHGFRATFKTWAGETTAFPLELIEASLAHKIAGDVEAAYRRGSFLDKRRRLMALWTDYCGGRIPANQAADVVAFPGAA